MEYLSKKLSAQYPDIAIIQEIYKELTAQGGHQGPDQGQDSKYRPLPLLLAVLYRSVWRKIFLLHLQADICWSLLKMTGD